MADSNGYSCAGCGAPLEPARAEYLVCQFCHRKNKNPNPPPPPPVQPTPPKEAIRIIEKPVPRHQPVYQPEPPAKQSPISPLMFLVILFGLFFLGPILFFCVCCPLLSVMSPSTSTNPEPNSIRQSRQDREFDGAVKKIRKECESRNQVMNDKSAIEYILENNIKDSWGSLVAYKKIDDRHFKLTALGFDKKIGTDDDIDQTVKIKIRE